MAAHLLRKSAALFSDMMAERRLRTPRQADTRTPAEVLAAIEAGIALPAAAPLPGLIGALAMRGAVVGAHGVEVTR